MPFIFSYKWQRDLLTPHDSDLPTSSKSGNCDLNKCAVSAGTAAVHDIWKTYLHGS